MKTSIYENIETREKFEVEIPLECKVDVERLRAELEIPAYVDTNDFQMRKVIVALWAFNRNSSLSRPLRVALFGGIAFKIHCPSSCKWPLSRESGDIDFVTTRDNGREVVDKLCGLGENYGSMFFHFVPEVDQRFNALRAGMRYRLRTIKGASPRGEPIIGPMDIFCDKLNFCHTLDLREDLDAVANNYYTIGLENMIISKAQFIKQVPKSEAVNIDQTRIMGEYDKKNFLIGMEAKDTRDVAALLLDHQIGNDDRERIDLELLGEKLKRDWKIWKSVTMNLRNMLQKSDSILESYGVETTNRKVIANRLGEILLNLETKSVPKKGLFGLGKRWWEDVEEQAVPSAHM